MRFRSVKARNEMEFPDGWRLSWDVADGVPLLFDKKKGFLPLSRDHANVIFSTKPLMLQLRSGPFERQVPLTKLPITVRDILETMRAWYLKPVEAHHWKVFDESGHQHYWNIKPRSFVRRMAQFQGSHVQFEGFKVTRGTSPLLIEPTFGS